MLLTLPLPPTVNHYWGRSGHRSFLSKAAIEYRNHVIAYVKERNLQSFGDKRLLIHLLLSFKTKARNDLDNRAKGLLDSLMHAGLFDDDSQVDYLEIQRGSIDKAGKCVVFIEEVL
jgi:crossover junction endodeoxyribonuclease RusA